MTQTTNDAGADIRRILVVRPNHRLGNNVLLTPLLGELERRFPKAEIEILTGGGASHNLYAEFRALTAVHAFPGWSYIRPHIVARIIRRVRARKYDLAIDSTTKSRSARFLLVLVRARRKVGYAWGVGWRDRILTDAVSAADAPLHHGRIPVHLVRQVFGEDGAPIPTLDLRLPRANERSVDGSSMTYSVCDPWGVYCASVSTAPRQALSSIRMIGGRHSSSTCSAVIGPDASS